MDKFTQWLARLLPPVQNAGQTASTGFVTTATTTSNATAIQLIGKVLVPTTPPNEAPSNLGELPSSGEMRVQFQAGAQDVWVLFGPNSSVKVDPTDATAAQIGWRIPSNTAQIFCLNPTDHAYMSCGTAGTSAVLRYAAISSPTNNRP